MNIRIESGCGIVQRLMSKVQRPVPDRGTLDFELEFVIKKRMSDKLQFVEDESIMDDKLKFVGQSVMLTLQ